MSHSANWAALLPAAMVGTDRQPLAATSPLAGPVGALLNDTLAQTPDSATALLRAAGITASCSLAGGHGLDIGDAPAAAAADPRPPLQSGPLMALLPWVVAEGPARLHQAVFQGLDRTGLQLPPRFLPAALELGRRSVALRPWLAPVLGERGRWLAAQRDEWRYATGASDTAPPETLWSEGNLEQRKALLHTERTHSPDAARQRLTAALMLIENPERFCTTVSEITRTYLEERFGLKAPERTTEEFLAELPRNVVLDKRHKDLLGEFLTQCDLVKFARFEPGRRELEDLHHAALRLVEETAPRPVPPVMSAQPVPSR